MMLAWVMLNETSDLVHGYRRQQLIIGSVAAFLMCVLLIEFGPAKHLMLILGTCAECLG